MPYRYQSNNLPKLFLFLVHEQCYACNLQHVGGLRAGLFFFTNDVYSAHM
uniref:Uncharacterized protein n=1 Tax=Anguilla anguilla TaxID=7936 RepID=A0A0E9TL34_ANGAN